MWNCEYLISRFLNLACRVAFRVRRFVAPFCDTDAMWSTRRSPKASCSGENRSRIVSRRCGVRRMVAYLVDYQISPTETFFLPRQGQPQFQQTKCQVPLPLDHTPIIFPKVPPEIWNSDTRFSMLSPLRSLWPKFRLFSCSDIRKTRGNGTWASF